MAHGWAPIGSHHVRLVLQPGETHQIVFVLGYHENPKDKKFDPPDSQTVNKTTVKPVIARYRDKANVDAAFEKLRSYWDGLLGICQVQTPDVHTDRMVNVWNAYQCMATFNMSRSASFYESGIGRGLGFRDSNQDLLGFVQMVPERARERILDLAATQLPDGGAYHQYQPLTKKGNNDVGSNFNDDPHWLIIGVSAYLKETGDWSILDEPVQFDNQPGSEQPLYEHLRRSFGYTLARLGPHGLPLIGRADWNDCLNLNCFSDTPGQSFQTTTNKEGKVAESVFIAALFVLAAKELAAIAKLRGLDGEAKNCLEESARMEETRAPARLGWRVVPPRLRRLRQEDRFEGVRGREDLHRDAGLLRARRHRPGGRYGAQGARFGAPAPGHAARHHPAAAGILELPSGTRRDFLLSAGLQGERRAFSATTTRG